jgi:prepilin-type N-terminal cleavage/methylation domain-containing protein
MNTKPTTRRGMTLLETLAALGLLGALAAASFGWITASQRTLVETSERTQWKRTADATLAILHDDLAAIDQLEDAGIEIRSVPTDQQMTETIISLRFQSRCPGIGPCEIRYEHDDELGTLTRVVDDSRRMLIGRLTSVELQLPNTVDEPNRNQSVIIVRLTSHADQSVQRLIPLRGREIAR